MRRIAGIGLLLCGAVLATSAPSGVWVATATTPRPHWTGTRERTIVIENNLPPEWLAPLRAAAADWSRSPYVKFVLGPAGTCWDLATRVEFCWSSYTPTPSWIGLASTWRDDAGHLSYVTLEANALKSWGPGKRRYVACHELGHALAASHRTEVTGQSCMVPKFSDVTIFPAKPDPVDLDALMTAYAHRDVAPSTSATESPSSSAPPTPTESPTSVDPEPSPPGFTDPP